MDHRLVLKFPQRRVLVHRVSMTRLEVELIDVSDAVQIRGPHTELTWPNWHEQVEGQYGVGYGGWLRGWVEDYSPTELRDLIDRKYRDNCTVKALGAMDNFQGYLTIEGCQFALTDGHTVLQLVRKPSEGIMRNYQLPGQVMRASNFFNPEQGPFIKNAILKRPYTLTRCWCSNTGEALIDIHEFLHFVERSIGRIADPFAWETVKPSNDSTQQVTSLASALAIGYNDREPREFMILHEEEIPWPTF